MRKQTDKCPLTDDQLEQISGGTNGAIDVETYNIYEVLPTAVSSTSAVTSSSVTVPEPGQAFSSLRSSETESGNFQKISLKHF